MKRVGIMHTLTGYEVHSVVNVKELTIQEMYKKFLSEPVLSYGDFKDFIEEVSSPMFDGTTLKADIRLVSAAEWTDIKFKANQFDKLVAEVEGRG